MSSSLKSSHPAFFGLFHPALRLSGPNSITTHARKIYCNSLTLGPVTNPTPQPLSLHQFLFPWQNENKFRCSTISQHLRRSTFSYCTPMCPPFFGDAYGWKGKLLSLSLYLFFSPSRSLSLSLSLPQNYRFLAPFHRRRRKVWQQQLFSSG